MNSFWKRSQLSGALKNAIAVCVLSSTSAFAAGVTLSTTSVIVDPATSMDSFDVDLTNLGPSAFTISAFSFDLSIANPSISFTDATTSTGLTYVFASNSLFGPDLTGPNSGQTIAAADVDAIPLAATSLNPGQAVGLAHIFFDVAKNAAPGKFAVSFAPYPGTSLADVSANNINVDVFSPGQITITGTPEPSSLFLVLFSLSVFTLIPRRIKASHSR